MSSMSSSMAAASNLFLTPPNHKDVLLPSHISFAKSPIIKVLQKNTCNGRCIVAKSTSSSRSDDDDEKLFMLKMKYKEALKDMLITIVLQDIANKKRIKMGSKFESEQEKWATELFEKKKEEFIQLLRDILTIKPDINLEP